MTWRDEVKALIVSIVGGAPDVVIEVTSAGAWCRRVGPGVAFISALPRGAARGVCCRPDALPLVTSTLASAALSFVGCDQDGRARRAILDELRRALAPEAVLIVVDHNRPRQPFAALAALLRAPRVPGRSPGSRWRRLAYPSAREAQAAGFVVEGMRLAAGERIQAIAARKRQVSRNDEREH